MPDRRWIHSLMLALLSSGMFGLASPAFSQQHQHGAVHQRWSFPEPAWNVDTWANVAISKNSMFYNSYMVFEGNPGGDDGMYLGLQQEGGGARQVRFSIWNTTTASPAPGASCQAFGGEGVGMTCTLPFHFHLNRWYNLRVWRLSTHASGWEWGAWVIDTVTGAEHAIGTIKAPPGTMNLDDSTSFNEYYGPAVPCNAVPNSKVAFLQPILNNDIDIRAGYDGTTILNCSGGAVTPAPGFASTVLELGVPPACGFGPELALMIPALAGARRLQRRRATA